jgi:hypothetical protein
MDSTVIQSTRGATSFRDSRRKLLARLLLPLSRWFSWRGASEKIVLVALATRGAVPEDCWQRETEPFSLHEPQCSKTCSGTFKKANQIRLRQQIRCSAS